VQNYERTWRKVELFLGVFFVGFVICAGGMWIRDNQKSLKKLFDTKTYTARPQSFTMPNIQGAYNNLQMQDWNKFTPPPTFTMPKINIPPPQIPQIRVPYITPPPPPIGFRR
jgi:hypothetical protein